VESHRSFALTTLLACLALTLPGAALAQEADGGEADDRIVMPYVEYRAGVSFVPNQNVKGADATGSNLWGSARMQEGYNVGGAAGVRFLEFFRAEVAVDFRQNDVEDLGVVGGNTNARGDVSLMTAMLNGYFDYDLGVGVIPFVGAGVGYGLFRFDAESPQIQVSDKDSVVAWNFMIGGTYPFSDVTDVSLGYRYLATEDLRFKSRFRTGPTTTAPRRVESEYDAHELFLALRFKF